MQGRTWLVLGMLALLVSTGRAQTPTSAPTVCPAADQADLKTTLDALKQRIKDQDRRIADLESKQGNDEKVRREEIIAVLKDMKLIGDKRAEDIRAFWKDGLRFETNDGNFKLALNGRAFVDFDWLGGNKLGNAIKKEQRDGIEFRSVRLKASGDIRA